MKVELFKTITIISRDKTFRVTAPPGERERFTTAKPCAFDLGKRAAAVLLSKRSFRRDVITVLDFDDNDTCTSTYENETLRSRCDTGLVFGKKNFRFPLYFYATNIIFHHFVIL